MGDIQKSPLVQGDRSSVLTQPGGRDGVVSLWISLGMVPLICAELIQPEMLQTPQGQSREPWRDS